MPLTKEQEEKLYPKVSALVEVMRKKYDGMLDGMEPALSVDITKIAAQLLEAQRKEYVQHLVPNTFDVRFEVNNSVNKESLRFNISLWEIRSGTPVRKAVEDALERFYSKSKIIQSAILSLPQLTGKQEEDGK